MAQDTYIEVPFTKEQIHPGDIIKIGRFSSDEWTVCFGWYEFGGNRPVCGWYLAKDGGLVIKPLQLPDLDDILIITSQSY